MAPLMDGTLDTTTKVAVLLLLASMVVTPLASLGQSPADPPTQSPYAIGVPTPHVGSNTPSPVNALTRGMLGAHPFCTSCLIGNISTGGEPEGVAFDPLNGEVLVADAASAPCCSTIGNLTMINGTLQQVTTSVPVGEQPMSVTIDPANGELFVADRMSNDVWVLNGTTDAVMAKVAVGSRPTAIAYDLANGMVYVANSAGGGTGSDIAVLNASSNSLSTTLMGYHGADGIAVDPQNDEVFVSNGGARNVTVLNGSDDLEVGQVTVGSAPAGLAYDPFNDLVYVANFASMNVSIFNAKSHAVVGQVAGAGINLFGVAVDPHNGEVAVTDEDLQYDIGSVDLINATTNLQVAKVGTSGTATGVAWDGAMGVFVVGENGTDSITLLDPGTYTSIIESVTVSPSGVILSPTGSYDFNATARCVAAPCPGPVSYIWSLNSTADASLNTTVGTMVNLTAGPRDGYVQLYANAYVQGETLRSAQTSVQISGNSTALGQISVSPRYVAIGAGNSTTLTASCAGGCPVFTQFTWTVSNPTLGTYYGGGTQGGYTAGAHPGNLTMNVTATYQGLVHHASAHIEILPLTTQLTSVTVSPTMSVLAEGTTVSFFSTPTCSNGQACPYTLMNYSWTLTNALGTLRYPNDPSTSFTAGFTPGRDTLFLNASMAGVTRAITPVPLTIVTGPLPTILSLSLTPSSTTLVPGGSQSYAVVPACSSACPAGDIAYTWSVYPTGYGNLNVTSGAEVTFHATGYPNFGATLQLTAVATLGTSSSTNQSNIDVLPSNSLELTGVSVQPVQANVIPGGTLNLTAEPQCAFPGACGPGEGILYSWSISNTLGTISTSTTPNAWVLFHAGSAVGVDTVFVNASQYGVSYVGSPGTVNISASAVTVTSVSVQPSVVEVKPGAAQLFTANVVCSTTCPSSLAYRWNFTGNSGHINPQLDPAKVAFDAGPKPGTDLLKVQVSLGGVSRTAWANITVGNGTLSGGGGPSSGFDGVLVAVVVVIMAVVAVTVLALWMRRRRGNPTSTPAAVAPPPEPAPPPVTPGTGTATPPPPGRTPASPDPSTVGGEQVAAPPSPPRPSTP